jgi:hypothetical protein
MTGFASWRERDQTGVRLYTRNGYRFPRIVEAVESLPVHSCFIDGEASSMPTFVGLQYDSSAQLLPNRFPGGAYGPVRALFCLEIFL